MDDAQTNTTYHCHENFGPTRAISEANHTCFGENRSKNDCLQQWLAWLLALQLKANGQQPIPRNPHLPYTDVFSSRLKPFGHPTSPYNPELCASAQCVKIPKKILFVGPGAQLNRSGYLAPYFQPVHLKNLIHPDRRAGNIIDPSLVRWGYLVRCPEEGEETSVNNSSQIHLAWEKVWAFTW